MVIFNHLLFHSLPAVHHFNPLGTDVICRCQIEFSFNFSKKKKKSQNLDCHCHIWIQHEKCIQMSTNKPSIGSVVLEIAS